MYKKNGKLRKIVELKEIIYDATMYKIMRRIIRIWFEHVKRMNEESEINKKKGKRKT